MQIGNDFSRRFLSILLLSISSFMLGFDLVKDSNVNLRKAAIMACASLAAVMKSALKRMDSVDQAPGRIFFTISISFTN